MRDLISDLEAGRHQPDAGPAKPAQAQMRQALPKRFYKSAGVVEEDGGHAVRLDGRPVRTPGRAFLALPTAAAAGLVAAEFDAQGETVDPFTMPVLRLANTAIDGVASDTQAVLEDMLRYASSDLLCYRAAAPDGLVRRQGDAWDPVLDQVRAVIGARFHLAEGVMHVEQPREAIAALGVWLRRREEPFRLAALHVVTTLTGSALLAIAVEAGWIGPDECWAAAHVDEDWNAAQWGEDAEAMARRAARRRDFDASVALVRALDN